MDAELVRRGLARSREHAQELITSGRVLISGVAATKPATAVEAGTPLRVVEVDNEVSCFAGRPQVARSSRSVRTRWALGRGKRCLDAGASTGASRMYFSTTAPGRWSRWMSDTASWCGGCSRTIGFV